MVPASPAGSAASATPKAHVQLISQDDLQVAKVAPTIQQGSSQCGCLYAVTREVPTNHDMLVFRTLNPMLKAPGHNADILAPRIRDSLLPVRSWWLKHVPWAKYQLKNTLENRVWGVPGCISFIDARTKWFDQGVLAALADGIKQVVVIAAGYDTRAYRLAPPGGQVKFFEIDLPTASKRKAALAKELNLAPKGVELPVYVGADLSQVNLATALAGTSFDPTQPTLFTMEGLIYYLPPTAALDLVATICRLAATGSKIMFDFMHSAALEGRPVSDAGFKYAGFKVTAKAVANKGEPYRFGIKDSAESVAAFLAAASRQAAAAESAADGKAPVPATDGPVKNGLRLTEYLSPKDMTAQQLPHLEWNDRVPPIAAFYSYASAVKM